MRAFPFPARLVVVFTFCGLIALGAACKANKDIGQTCAMTKPCTGADGGSCPIAPDKVSNAGIDYIALGSAECDDLACIRTAKTNNPPNTAESAQGYCTSPCIEDSDCQPDYQGKEKTMKCERLLLDEAFLDQLKQNQPQTYDQMFGSGASSRYCILPRQ